MIAISILVASEDFVLSFSAVLICVLMLLFLIGLIFILINGALFFDDSCRLKVPRLLQNETPLWMNETSSKFSYHNLIGLFWIFPHNKSAN